MLFTEDAAMQAALIFLWGIEIAGLVLTFEEFGLKLTDVCLKENSNTHDASCQDCLELQAMDGLAMG